MDILLFLQYGFIQRALVTGCSVALLCSLLGVLLVLRRLSLIGDGLAHVTFGSVALGLLLRVQPFYVSLPVVMISSLAILKLTEKARVYGDAAIGIVSAVGIAGGIMLASVARGFNIDLFSYLFGNILAIGATEMYLSIVFSLAVVSIITLLYKQLLSISFDEESAFVSGINTTRMNELLAVLTAVAVVLTMRLVGIMLTSALLIVPAVSAFQVARSFKGAMIIAATCALISVISGIFLSFAFDVPAGALIVLLNFGFFLILLCYKSLSAKRMGRR